MGRHTIGYEVQKVLAAVDVFRARRGTCPLKRGPRRWKPRRSVSLATPRVVWWLLRGRDRPPDRRRARERLLRSARAVWQEPIDRNIWSLLERFGDAEIASLVLPRHLIVEHAAVPSFTSSKGARQTPAGASVRSEFGRIPRRRVPEPSLVIGRGDVPVGPLSAEALADFATRLGFKLIGTSDGVAADAAAVSMPRHVTSGPWVRSSGTSSGWCTRRSRSAIGASSLPYCRS